MERQLVVKPLGLVTQPNKLGVFPPGALRIARNMVMRSPGEIHQSFVASQFVGSWAPTYGTFATPSQLVNIASHTPATSGTWYPYWVDDTGTRFNDGDMPGEVARKFSSTGRMQAITFRDRLIINGDPSPAMVCDYPDPQTAAQRSFRYVGLPQPRLVDAVDNGNGLAVDTNFAVSYAVIAKRVFADGYTLISSPSPIGVFFNSALTPQQMSLRAEFTDSSGQPVLLAGDVLEFYRSQALAGTAANVPVPGTTLYKVHEHVLTSAEAFAGFILVTDNAKHSAFGTPLAGLGEELYTNPANGGSGRSRETPPSSLCLSNWRGRAWYSNCKLQGAFTVAFRGGFGNLDPSYTPYTVDARRTGVGSRLFTGTFTSGSATVTGISAADMVGLAGGQYLSAVSGVPAATYIATTGVSSLTMTSLATSSSTHAHFSFDTIEVNGVRDQTNNFLRQYSPLKLSSARTLLTTGIAYNQQLRVTTHRLSAFGTGEITVRATNGQNYDPPVPLISETPKSFPMQHLKNYVRWSDDQQPESCPPTNELWVGSGEILGVASTRDCQWYFCTDGLWRLSGSVFPINGVPDLRVDPVDPTLILSGPRAFCVLRDAVYANTNRGFVRITDGGIEELSTGIIGDLIPGAPWAESVYPCVSADERVDEVHVLVGSAQDQYVYSARYNCWTSSSQWETASQGLYVPWLRAPAFVDQPGEVTVVLPTQTLHTSGISFVEFQPLHGKEADALKQWIDMTLIFDRQATGQVFPRFNGVQYVVSGAPTIDGNDMRQTYGVPRAAPALCPTITPGFTSFGTNIRRFSGMQLRFVTIGDQQVQRP